MRCRAPRWSMGFVVYGMTATATQLLSYGAWSASHEGGIAIEFLVDRLSLAFRGTRPLPSLALCPPFRIDICTGSQATTVTLSCSRSSSRACCSWRSPGTWRSLHGVGTRRSQLGAARRVLPGAAGRGVECVSCGVGYRDQRRGHAAAAVLLRHVAGTDSLSLLFGGAVATAGLTPPTRRSSPSSSSSLSLARARCCPFRAGCPGDGGSHTLERGYYGSLSIHAGCSAAARQDRCWTGRPRPGCSPAVSARPRHCSAGSRHVQSRCGVGSHMPRSRKSDHRHLNGLRLVSARVHPPDRTRILSPAAISECAERSTICTRLEHAISDHDFCRTVATSRSLGFDRARRQLFLMSSRTRIPRHHSRPYSKYVVLGAMTDCHVTS